MTVKLLKFMRIYNRKIRMAFHTVSLIIKIKKNERKICLKKKIFIEFSLASRQADTSEDMYTHEDAIR